MYTNNRCPERKRLTGNLNPQFHNTSSPLAGTERRRIMQHTTPNPSLEQTSNMQSLTQRLAAPFDPAEVRFKPAVVSGNRALALAYVDARVIQDRLDEVLGVDGWQDDYESLADGSVVCR